MTINVERDFELVTLEITGRLDSTTAPNLETVIKEISEDTKELLFDMSELEYISSAGVRVLLGAYKKMQSNQGIMRVEKANDMVLEVFEMKKILAILLQSVKRLRLRCSASVKMAKSVCPSNAHKSVNSANIVNAVRHLANRLHPPTVPQAVNGWNVVPITCLLKI